MPELTTVTVPIDSVRPHPRNVRRGDVESIRESLRRHGQYVPIVVQRSTRFIVKGNHTWQAMKAEGMTTVEIVERDYDDRQAIEVLLGDNRTSDLAAYEDAELAELLASLDTLEGTGYTDTDLADLLATLDPIESGGGGGGSSGFERESVKTLALTFTASDFDRLTARLAEVMEARGLTTQAAAVLDIVMEG